MSLEPRALTTHGVGTIRPTDTVRGVTTACAVHLFSPYAGPVSDTPRLIECIDLGVERSLAQDPLFGFRIIVNIPAKAMAPASDDPSTDLLAIDQWTPCAMG